MKGDPDTGDPDIGDLDMGDPDMGDPDMGDPDMGDPDMGDPDMGHPDTGDLGMLAAGEHPPVPAGDRFARILRSELDFPGLLAATLDARKEEDARNAGQ